MLAEDDPMVLIEAIFLSAENEDVNKINEERFELQGVSKKVPTMVLFISRLLKHLKKWFCTFFNSPAFAESNHNNILILGLKLEKLLMKM